MKVDFILVLVVGCIVMGCVSSPSTSANSSITSLPLSSVSSAPDGSSPVSPSVFLPTSTPLPSPEVTSDGSAGNSKVPDLGPGVDLHGYRPFPDDNAWNQDVSSLPVDPNSDLIISAVGSHPLHPDFGTVWDGAPNGIPYVVVSGDQLKVNVSFDYADESDAVGYPIPSDVPIEGGPDGMGDRHVLLVDRDNHLLYELFDAHANADGSWHAGSGAVFNLSSNALRPARWTSADAAGLPIFPGLVRYDEVVGRGVIDHALRFTLPDTRQAFVCPARHFASSLTDAKYAPMGARFRLKASFDVSGFPKNDQVILNALKKYGMFLADNGSPLFLSGAPDSRWSDDELASLKKVATEDFEVVQMPDATGPTGDAVVC